ncbi:hypothetical protein B7P43_G18122 [Cryptotermes secundus]|uniref:Uncharacterized protein n=1 Tax=Cryptotermes secundus TaxID=105785 RepID=A0A2J7RS54_9NEOP|nr:hypothetical protein B7P43_G18122 [Cryptotermes secundus]
MAEEYVSEALKLVTPAFEVINPIHVDRLYKFVLTKISGEPRIAIAHRNLETWAELKEFLTNTYVEKRTLDFHANALEEESAIFSKNERYKGPEKCPMQCTNCKKTGHPSSRCYVKYPQADKVNVSNFRATSQNKEFVCWNCGEGLRRCKSLEPRKYICKQIQPLLNSHMQETCAIKLLQPRLNIPKVCDTRVVQLTHTIWTQLENRNEWIYFIPMRDSITILCPNKEPLDVVLTSTEKLTIRPGCKGYGLTALLATKTDTSANVTKRRRPIVKGRTSV